MKIKYRIVEHIYEDKSVFVPQYRHPLWPFWSNYRIVCVEQFGGSWTEVVEFDTREAALAHINADRAEFTYKTKRTIVHEVV